MKYCDICRTSYPTEFTTCPKDQSPLRTTSELLQGMIIREKYEILRKIGSGGMATVYTARHTAFNEIRALKVVSSKMLDDENFLKRFRNEAIVTRKLQHPNAVRVDDIDSTEDGRPFIVMEYVEGENLRHLIQKEGPLPAERALGIAKQAAAALGAAHKMSIVHRDVKPDNIIVRKVPDGDFVKVLDFGIAKAREQEGKGAYTATQTGMVIGTPQYISPEQALGKRGDEIDGRADLYSLAIVLFEMLTGQMPFECDTPMGLLLAQIGTPAPTPQERSPEVEVPEPVTKLLMKALEKEPGARFQTADEFIAALDNPEAWARANAEEESAPDTGTAVMGSMGAQTIAATTPKPTVVQTQAAAAAAARARTTVVAPKPAAAPPSARPRVAPPPTKKSFTAAIAGTLLALVIVLGGGGYWYKMHRASAQAVSPAQTTATPTPPQATQPQPVPQGASSGDTNNASGVKPPEESESVRRARQLIGEAKSDVDNGNYDQAIAKYKQALVLDPGNKAAQVGMTDAARAKKAEEQVLGRH